MGLHKQQGMTLTQMLLVLIVVVLGVNFIIKMSPHYMDDYYVGTIFDDLEVGVNIRESSPRKIKDAVIRRFSVSSIDGLDELVLVDKNDERVRIDLNYERREPILGNVDVVMKFKHEYEYSL